VPNQDQQDDPTAYSTSELPAEEFRKSVER
jgi:hypothetical protein